MVKVLFVCMGNICRSPTAEAVFRRHVEEADLAEQIFIDSAGTHGYHIGMAPDVRACVAALDRGMDMRKLKARQVEVADFQRFDFILVMDNANLEILQSLCPADYPGHLGLFMAYAKAPCKAEVPDPYYGGAKGFEQVLDMIEEASTGLLQEIISNHLGITSAKVTHQ